MKNLLILVKMQLKEQFNFKRLEVENVSLFHVMLSTILAVLKFAMVTALCYAFLFVSEFIGIFDLIGRPVPARAISLIFAVMLVLSIFSCIVGLTKSMYYARDNAVLLTLPTLPIQVYLSKLIIFSIFEFKRNLSFLVPLFIAYFISWKYPIGAYPWMLISMLLISLFTVSIGALLSIPAMWAANFFRQRKWLQLSAIGTMVVAIVIAVFYGISIIPDDINLIEDWPFISSKIYEFLRAYMENFSLVHNLSLIFLGNTDALVATFDIGETAMRFGILFGITAALFVLGILIVKPLFYKMASTPFEYLKKTVKPKPNKLRTRRYASVYTEFLSVAKNTNRLFSNFGILFSLPMLVFLFNKIFLSMNTRDLGNYMVVAFNVLIIMLIMLNANTYASSLFSREGRSSYLIKTQPSKYPILILSKLLPNSAFVFVSFVATFVIMKITMPIAFLDLLMLVSSIGFVYLAHLFYCAELDLMNPQTELYATVGNKEINPNEVKATASAFLISFISAGAVFYLLFEGEKFSVYIKFILIAFFAFLYRAWIFGEKLKLYYKEK